MDHVMPAGNLVCGNRSYRIWNSPPLFLCSFVLPSHSLPSRLRSRIGFHGRDHLKYHPHLSHLCPIALTPAYCLPAIAGQCPQPIKHIYHPYRCPHLASSRLHLVFWTTFHESASDLRDRPLSFPNPVLFFSHASANDISEASHLLPQAFSCKGARVSTDDSLFA